MKTELLKDVPTAPARSWSNETKKLYRTCCLDLLRRGRLWPATLHLIHIYCDSYEIYNLATKQINEDTANLTKTDRDTTRKSALFGIRKTAVDEMKNYERKLGFSPYYADRINASEVTEEKDIMDF